MPSISLPAIGASIAAAAPTIGLVGTAVSAGGAVLGGIAQSNAASYQAKVAENNAQIAKQNATYALEAGNEKEQQAGLRAAEEGGIVKTSLAANNVDVNMGSAAAAQASTRTVGAMEAAMIHYNAAREAYGHQVQAVGLQSQAALYRRAGLGALEEAGYKSASTIIAGASSLSSKAAQYGLAFGQPSSAVPSVWGS